MQITIVERLFNLTAYYMIQLSDGTWIQAQSQCTHTLIPRDRVSQLLINTAKGAVSMYDITADDGAQDKSVSEAPASTVLPAHNFSSWTMTVGFCLHAITHTCYNAGIRGCDGSECECQSNASIIVRHTIV